MKNKIFAAVGVTAVAAATLTGCTAGSEAVDGATTITFWNSFTADDRPAVEELVERYNDSQDGVVVELNIMPGDVLGQKLLPAFQSGTGPTIVAIDPSQVPGFAEKKVIQPLDGLYEEGELDVATLPESQIAATTWDGKRYGAPMSAATAMLYYNKALLTDAGISEPATTLEGLAEQAVALTEYVEGKDTTNQYGFVIADHAAVPVWASLLWSWGGGVVSADGTESLLGSSESIAAADYWVDLIREQHISPVGLSGVDAGAIFQAGRAAYVIEGPWASAGYSEAGINFGVTTVPAGPAAQSSVAVGATMTLNSASSDAERDAAYDFMTFWNSVESQTYWSIETSYPPNRTDIDAADISENPTAAAFAQSQDSAFFPGGPVVDFAKIFDDIFIPSLQKMTNGEGAPADVLPTASDQIDALLP
ncbi:ABC transporter substrate-binding protein [Microbacterium sp. A84]|uniref:ABC transporter substrate-binding protein n=1 Tax=Microbacterium sp. A84 TaxID=3450715 RepID=UPI003F436FED